MYVEATQIDYKKNLYRLTAFKTSKKIIEAQKVITKCGNNFK